MNTNPETQCDCYKLGHINQYPYGTQLIVSNYTARGTRRANTEKVVFFGLQYFVKEYLIKQWNENFFKKPKDEVLARFERRITGYLGPNQINSSHIEALHDLGYLPITILALPEGTEHKLRVPSLVIYNTKDEFFWLTNYLETVLSTIIWGPCTSATTAFQYRKLLTQFAKETVGNDDFVPWQGHDFSFRGMYGMEAALMSGGAHLTCFTGSDTVPAVDWLEEYYNANSELEMVAGSVNATEHSVACSTILNIVNQLTKDPVNFDLSEEELLNLADIGYVNHLIKEVYPTGIVSIVADSFDYWNTITNTARILKNEIMARNGKVVFRPDTGDPVKVVVGEIYPDYTNVVDGLDEARKYAKGEIVDKVRDETPHGECGPGVVEQIFKYQDAYYKVKVEIEWNRYDKQYYYIDGNRQTNFEQVELTARQKGSIECLWEIFGGTVSEQGYKVLDQHVGLIYGDSITLQRAKEICEGLKAKGFASTNIVFGIGSYTYQYVTRDTDGYAVKATFARINDTDREIYKAPKDSALKKSARGLTAVFKDENGEYYLKDQATWEEMNNCEFVKVFEDGKLLKDYTLQEIRNNIKQYI
jgi:nicotinamide phosphoribosyltransferase